MNITKKDQNKKNFYYSLQNFFHYLLSARNYQYLSYPLKQFAYSPIAKFKKEWGQISLLGKRLSIVFQAYFYLCYCSSLFHYFSNNLKVKFCSFSCCVSKTLKHAHTLVLSSQENRHT